MSCCLLVAEGLLLSRSASLWKSNFWGGKKGGMKRKRGALFGGWWLIGCPWDRGAHWWGWGSPSAPTRGFRANLGTPFYKGELTPWVRHSIGEN